MSPDDLVVGKRFPGDLPQQDESRFEFSKYGPELRLFFSDIPDDVVRRIGYDDCYFGLLRSDDIAVVLWKIGDVLGGDAQFHVHLYLPEMRPTPEIMEADAYYKVQITLVDRATGTVRAIRRIALSPQLSKQLNEEVAYQHGNHITPERYDAEVSAYQSRYPNVEDAMKAAPIFEKAGNRD